MIVSHKLSSLTFCDRVYEIKQGKLNKGMLNNKSILITGGTGTFGKAFVKNSQNL